MKSLERAVQLLESLMPTNQDDWSISELVDRTGLPLGTLHRMLTAWQELGFVRQDVRTKRYRLGLKLMSLGMELWRNLDVRTVARPVMIRLSKEVRETVHLTVREGLDGVILDLVEGPSPLRVMQNIGLRLPLNAGGSKKVLMAYLPETEQEEIISLLTWQPVTMNTVTDPDVLRKHLALIRERGYEVSYGETMSGTAGCSVPIWGPDGRVLAGLMTSGPEIDFRGERTQFIVEATVRAGKEISDLLGNGGADFASKRSQGR